MLCLLASEPGGDVTAVLTPLIRRTLERLRSVFFGIISGQVGVMEQSI